MGLLQIPALGVSPQDVIWCLQACRACELQRENSQADTGAQRCSTALGSGEDPVSGSMTTGMSGMEWT